MKFKLKYIVLGIWNLNLAAFECMAQWQSIDLNSQTLTFKNVGKYFGHVGKRLGKKAEVNFKNCVVINWKTNNNNTHISQHLKKLRRSDNESDQLTEYYVRNISF